MARKKNQQKRERDEARQKARREDAARESEGRIHADDAMREALRARRTPLQLWTDVLEGRRPDGAHRLPVPRPGAGDRHRAQALLDVIRVANKRAPNTLTQDNFRALWELAGQKWIRPVDDWRPTGRSRRTRLASLTEHLLALYPVPAFIYGVLDEDDPTRLADGLYLLAELGRGESPRALVRDRVLRAPLTKRMCTLWLEQKVHLEWLEAIRHAQVQALGGERRLAEALCGTRLGRGWQPHEAFWQTAIQWLCNQAMLNPREVGPLVDYIRHRRDQDATWTLKGRTPASLARGMADWHGELARVRRGQLGQFQPSGLSGARVEMRRRGKTEVWTVTEVLENKELVAEGKALRHCVYSYAGSIRSGRCSIWSVRLWDDRVLTVEVTNASRRIVQVRGFANRAATEREGMVLRQWAAQAGLNLNVSRW